MNFGDRLIKMLNHHLDKVLFVLGLGYLGAVGYWLWARQQPLPPQVSAPARVQKDGEFITQLQKALQNIPPSSTPSPRPPLPSLSLAASPTPTLPPSSTTIIEKHYYPVYPSPSTPQTLKLPPHTLPQSTPVAIAPLVTKKQTYQLIGVLEAGEQSYALFTTEEGPLRLQVQESLGSSGWVLAKVDQQKALLVRQGKTRYVEVGQIF